MRFLRSLQWRIALSYTALILISMGAVSAYLVNYVRHSYTSNLEERLEQETHLVSETTAPYFQGGEDLIQLQMLSERIGGLIDARVTIIAMDGIVLTDTWEDPSMMENHKTRPEIREAVVGSLGRSTRYSATVGEEMLYTAVPIEVKGTTVGIARVAVPTSEIDATIRSIVTTIALSGLVVAALAIGLGYLLARRTARSVRSVTEGARRLARGDLEHRVQALASDETRDLATTFNNMAAALRDTVRALSGERNRLRAVLDTMADGVIVVAPNQRIDILNTTAETLLGLEAQEAVGRRFVEMVRDHDLQRLVAESVRTEQQTYGEIELLPSRRFLAVVSTPLDEDGAKGALLTLHDLTRFHQVETTRKEFVSNVSHELRSPLASVKAMVETLEGGALEEEETARDFVARIHREVDRMSEMINDLLALSGLESGTRAFDLTAIDLGLVVHDVVDQFHKRAEVKHVDLRIDLPQENISVKGDSERLRQVLVNLLDNAIKFTLEGGEVTVSIALAPGFAEVSIADTGVGIPEEHQPHIFERFYKVDRARSEEGTGLGLAIVKHIVQAHGGEVRVDTEEGNGSTFTFTVPRAV